MSIGSMIHGDLHMSAMDADALEIRRMLAHPEFTAHIRTLKEDIRREIVSDFKEAFDKAIDDGLKKFIYRSRPLFVVIGFLSVSIAGMFLYRFNDALSSLSQVSDIVQQLNESVVELNVTLGTVQQQVDRVQRESDRNRDGLDNLKERVYRK